MLDSHCHLNLQQFEDDLEDTLARALGDGISGFVNIGFDRDTIAQTMELVERYPFFYGVVGVHPHDASEFNGELLADIHPTRTSSKPLSAAASVRSALATWLKPDYPRSSS